MYKSTGGRFTEKKNATYCFFDGFISASMTYLNANSGINTFIWLTNCERMLTDTDHLKRLTPFEDARNGNRPDNCIFYDG